MICLRKGQDGDVFPAKKFAVHITLRDTAEKTDQPKFAKFTPSMTFAATFRLQARTFMYGICRTASVFAIIYVEC